MWPTRGCGTIIHLLQLERERRNLTERLSETKEELLYSEKNLTETKKILKTSKESFHKTTEELRTQLLEVHVLKYTLCMYNAHVHVHVIF